ncbi:hypothetical protein JOM56_005574 [Amanita muscaria]
MTNLSKLVLVFFEECLDTLNSIIAAIGTIANVVDMTQMNPPVKDLLLRMTPILHNRHEKVQEASINLIGRIVLLRVQERQSCVCSFAIVAETCRGIPAILSEYRTAAELNVRTGCLKALSFVFEYILRIKVQIETNKPPTRLKMAFRPRSSCTRPTMLRWLFLPNAIPYNMPLMTELDVRTQFPSRPSWISPHPHAVTVQQGLLARISRTGVWEYHAFGMISEGKNSNKHFLICGVQGDFTQGLVNNPPTHLESGPFAGVSNTSTLYKRGIRVWTGTGIGGVIVER